MGVVPLLVQIAPPPLTAALLLLIVLLLKLIFPPSPAMLIPPPAEPAVFSFIVFSLKVKSDFALSLIYIAPP